LSNLFDDLPDARRAEVATDLLRHPHARIERIVSAGQSSPPGFWYDQDEDEWVIVLAGAAGIEVEGEPELTLGPGDHLFLPAHRKHRVAWTDPARQTVWLAVFLPAGS
jgi:cupin 2 domain-containing protein